ncbi:MAG: type I DNA topoisomerase [Parasporobacterium sp.]|nr:type I DNA topoisomerase [Parasporobacterium sp.]
MPKYLVIVESPAKMKTIKKFLGSNYEVLASNGHIRDLPKSQMGIDLEHDFEPKYITIRGKGEKLAELKKAAKKADKVYLATDPDREGEAISWHLAYALKLDDSRMSRITFNEITKNAVKASLKEPRKINTNLVDAQQARRALDRIVGYSISPVLWEKVKRGLSAGRVQSVALKMICDREAEINAFIQEEYWTLDAEMKVKGEKKPLIAKFYGNEKGKIDIKSKEEVDKIKKALKKEKLLVSDVKKSERTRKPALPFTTSTLQQEASKVLNFPTKKTMLLAQQLYEGVDIKGQGTIGLITYLRTDSTRISEEADKAARDFITENYGKEYVGKQAAKKAGGAKIQDAHEAIRPTDVNLLPSEIKENLSRDQFRLYQLIWKRFVASRMENAKYDTTNVKINAGDYVFKMNSSKVAFDGFMSVYVNEDEESEELNLTTHVLDKKSVIESVDYEEKQHFTQPPAHFTEAALVKVMEEKGIGRPSTYAPTISTILARRYVVKEGKNIFVTELGEAVNEIMVTAFSQIVNTEFTALMEGLLDKVEEGSIEWKNVIRNFYPDFAEAVEEAGKKLEKVKIEDEVTDVVCEECGRNMVIKYGPHGKFLACPGFPECRNTKPYYEKTGVKCPRCDGEIVVKKSKKGRRYFGCTNAPDCDFMSWQKPLEKRCPKCGEVMLEKGNKAVCFDQQCGYNEPLENKEK